VGKKARGRAWRKERQEMSGKEIFKDGHGEKKDWK
jgi:hypothetical protein